MESHSKTEEVLARNKNPKSGLISPFKGGDDQADLIDKSGKAWLAKKDESVEELKERAIDG